MQKDQTKMIRVLHLFTELDGGGVERFLLNYYSVLRHAGVQFDVIVPSPKIGILEPQFTEMKSKIFHVTRFRKNMFQNILQVFRIIRTGHYDIVHCHGYRSVLGVILAWFCGVKVRIIHSHMAWEQGGAAVLCRKQVGVILCKLFATQRYACGINAGIWLFGKKDYEHHRFEVIHNAIDLKVYGFRAEVRERVRRELGIQDKTVIGNVARLSYQKNQIFLLEVFAEYVKLDPASVLVLVGRGEMEDEIREYAQQLGIYDRVLFLSCRDDVQDLLCGFDIFVLPSRYEGLPVSLVEVQASGLPAVVADSVTDEVSVTDLLQYIPLKEGARVWAETIAEKLRSASTRKRTDSCMTGGRYDLTMQAQHLYDCYRELLSQKA